ncbi:putative metalloprotease CJM1_0395 family protein [Neptunomonas sp.]|uniref:putative metalloprotease CJM1_0395 family protein n=1 Tax=Neptunomonas sp. TaxID=1971898 RepID=UPI003565D866
MINSNYSGIMLRTSSVDTASAHKAVAPDKTQPHPSSSLSSSNTSSLSSSGAETQQIITDPTSVSATEATTHQSSDKQRLENDALISKELAQRDREVKTHERIHASIGGAFASAPQFSYQKGPDGQLYAVEGEVRIDTSAVSGDPRATLEKAQVIIRAALSVPEPSVQDKRVAAQARAMAIDASAEIAKLEKTLEGDAEGDLEASTAVAVEAPANGQTTEANVEKLSKQDQTDEESKDKKSLAEDNEDSTAESSAEIVASSQAAAASLQDFNNRLNDINKTLHDINLRLVETGVFEKLFPEGSIIDKNA